MSNFSKLLKSFQEQAALVIDSTGATPLSIVAKEITLDELGVYVTEQMAKAEADIESGATGTAAVRMQALMASTAAADAAFVDGVEKATIPLINGGATAASSALGKAAAAAARLADKAKGKGDDDGDGGGEDKTDKAKGDDGDDKTDKAKGDEGDGDGGDGDEVKKDDGVWSGSDLNDDPELRKLLEGGDDDTD